MSVVSLPNLGPLDNLDLAAIKRRFLALNRERLLRVQDDLRPRQRVFLDLLPLLLHINHPLLPGYESKKTPCGVSEYFPPIQNIETAKRMFKGFDYRRKAQRLYTIQAIYLMGSVGTIAYSETSDFDIWICHRADLGEAQQESLRRKCEDISRWAATLDLEVHFFVMDVARFKRGEHDALSRESSGGTQHRLLLEEFYRTGLLVTGHYPMWWLVPPSEELNYEAYVQRLISQRFVRDNEALDFGGLLPVPPGEFFGAALWQIYKAIASPYKSVLKLLLMEAYANDQPGTDLLAIRYKQAVYQSSIDLNLLDPYVMMCNKVIDFLQSRGEQERVELARRCFYFKVNERMSQPDPVRRENRRREALRALVDVWGWDHAQLLLMDARPTWKIHRVLEERAVMVDELTRSYRHLSQYARQHNADAPIDPNDLNLLGRKLYAAFERKAGKIEIVNPGISTNLVESHLSFHQSGSGEQEGWLLYRGDVNEAGTQRDMPIKRARSILELLAWCHFNRLMDGMTLLGLFNNTTTLTNWELRAITECLQQLYPDGQLAEADMDMLARPPQVLSSALFVNLGVDPLAKFTRQGMHLTSNRTDALSFGGQWENLAITFDQILVNSWQEILTLRHQGKTALLECLCEYLAWAPLDSGLRPPPIKVYSFSTTRGSAIARRIEGLFQDVIQWFYGQKSHAQHARYICRIEHFYYVLQAENNVPRYQRFDSYAALLKQLNEPQTDYSPLRIDQYVLTETPLPLIYNANRPDVVQVFFQTSGKTADVYVLDEHGSLFVQNTPFHDIASLQNQYQRFLETVLRRRATGSDPYQTTLHDSPLEFYQVLTGQGGRMRLEPRQLDVVREHYSYFDVQVIGNMIETGGTLFTMYCANREFSSLEHGDQLFREVARHIVDRRPSHELYPIYITDIDIPHSARGKGRGMQTVEFLNYKKKIEKRLNDAMHSL